MPTTNTPSRKKSDVHDILTWVECFNSYIAVLTSFRPERARDLLAYMTLIIHIAKQFPGRWWYNYDRAFRLEATASNLINWTQINSDLYHCHTSVAVQTSRPQTSRMRERRGNQSSPIACKSWNARACSSPHEFCRFRHKCDRAGCDGLMAHIAASSARNSFVDEGVVRETSKAVGDTQITISRDGENSTNIFSYLSMQNTFKLPDVSSFVTINVDNL